MGFEISSEVRSGYVFFTVTGEVAKDSLIELGKSIRQSCETAGVHGALIDSKGIEGALSTVDLYYATQQFVQAVGSAIKVAYINPPSHWIPADDKFSRDVAHNLGGSLEMFETESDAVKWLTDKETSPAD